MTGFDLSFDHFGLAVRDPGDALQFLAGNGYQIGDRVFDAVQNVNLILCTSDIQPDVELIYPSDSPGPVHKILERVDAGVYHLCYSAPDPAGSVAEMEAAGLRVICVSPPKPAVLFNHRKVSFYSVLGFGLIELLEAA